MALGSEFAHSFCAGIGPLQLGGVLVAFLIRNKCLSWLNNYIYFLSYADNMFESWYLLSVLLPLTFLWILQRTLRAIKISNLHECYILVTGCDTG